MAADASKHLQTIVQGEIKLAKLELKATFKNAGIGIALFVVALVLLAFSLTFGLIALALGIYALGLYLWLSFLVVFGFLLVLIMFAVLIGVVKVKKAKAPERTIATSKDTVAYLKQSTHRG